jgi:hypothetical protein
LKIGICRFQAAAEPLPGFPCVLTVKGTAAEKKHQLLFGCGDSEMREKALPF